MCWDSRRSVQNRESILNGEDKSEQQHDIHVVRSKREGLGVSSEGVYQFVFERICSISNGHRNEHNEHNGFGENLFS